MENNILNQQFGYQQPYEFLSEFWLMEIPTKNVYKIRYWRQKQTSFQGHTYFR